MIFMRDFNIYILYIYSNNATATINFSLAGVELLIEGGSYSRAAFITSERYLLVSCRDRPWINSFSGRQ